LAQANITILANIEYSPAAQEADLHKNNVFQASTGLVEQLREAKNALTSLIFPSVGSDVSSK
jgi:hypothetical protein